MDSELEDYWEKLSKDIPVLSDYVKGLGTRVKDRIFGENICYWNRPGQHPDRAGHVYLP